MRRTIALAAAVLLVASLAGSSLAAAPVPKSSSLTASFDLMTEDDVPLLVGHVTVQLFEPQPQRLVPGTYDFAGAAGNEIREAHAQVGVAHFAYAAEHWANGAAYPGANVASFEGVECVYYAPNNADCHAVSAMFIDPLDPAGWHEAAFATQRDADGQWNYDRWYRVGAGGLNLRFSGIDS